MSNDSCLQQEIRHSLGGVRSMIGSYSGLYSGEDLVRDVLKVCDDMARPFQPTQRVKEARHVVQERCKKLARDADRFSMQDPAVIAASRARAVASIDTMQDALFEMRKAAIAAPRISALLRRRGL